MCVSLVRDEGAERFLACLPLGNTPKEVPRFLPSLFTCSNRFMSALFFEIRARGEIRERRGGGQVNTAVRVETRVLFLLPGWVGFLE